MKYAQNTAFLKGRIKDRTVSFCTSADACVPPHHLMCSSHFEDTALGQKSGYIYLYI